MIAAQPTPDARMQNRKASRFVKLIRSGVAAPRSYLKRCSVALSFTFSACASCTALIVRFQTACHPSFRIQGHPEHPAREQMHFVQHMTAPRRMCKLRQISCHGLNVVIFNTLRICFQLRNRISVKFTDNRAVSGNGRPLFYLNISIGYRHKTARQAEV